MQTLDKEALMAEARQKLEVYAQIHDKNRLSILVTLFYEPNKAFNDLAREVGIYRQLLAHHIGILKDMNLVECEYEKRGRKLTKYRLTDTGVDILHELKLTGKT
ncbi:winged helix-turn-helix domain-containing protein [Candidatus Bathyarchaeota archaeon]|jgi:DNA-binding HxlR family transcriptional regulator|nr:winged helix-turn-helix domain-containing protein [Candidatus Bathyarchaeota archaeon]